jgi:L-rhamnose mutarotase
MRDKFIHDIAGDKIDVVQDAMSFYISLKAKDNSVLVLDELQKNLWRLQQPDKMFSVKFKDDDNVFNTLNFAEWLEASITNCIMKIDSLELEDDMIKKDKYNGEEFTQSLIGLYQSTGIRKLTDFDKRTHGYFALWNYDDEKMTMQFAIKEIMTEIVRTVMKSNDIFGSEEAVHVTVADVFYVLEDIRERITSAKLPQKRDEDSELSDDAADLISRAMFADKGYVLSVLDYLME